MAIPTADQLRWIYDSWLDDPFSRRFGYEIPHYVGGVSAKTVGDLEGKSTKPKEDIDYSVSPNAR